MPLGVRFFPFREVPSLKNLATRIHEVLEEHFFPTRKELWGWSGTAVELVIADIAGLSEEIAGAVKALLSSRYGELEIRTGSGEPPALQYEQPSPWSRTLWAHAPRRRPRAGQWSGRSSAAHQQSSGANQHWFMSGIHLAASWARLRLRLTCGLVTDRFIVNCRRNSSRPPLQGIPGSRTSPVELRLYLQPHADRHRLAR